MKITFPFLKINFHLQRVQFVTVIKFLTALQFGP